MRKSGADPEPQDEEYTINIIGIKLIIINRKIILQNLGNYEPALRTKLPISYLSLE